MIAVSTSVLMSFVFLFFQLVGSMDWPCFNLYKAAVRSQAGREEIVTELYTTKKGADGKTDPGGMGRQDHNTLPFYPLSPPFLLFQTFPLMLLEVDQLRS